MITAIQRFAFLALALCVPVGVAAAQTFVLQGLPGLQGESPIDCIEGGGCTLSGDLTVAGDVIADAVHADIDLQVDGVGTLLSVVASTGLVVSGHTVPDDCPLGYEGRLPGICEREVAAGVHDEVVAVGDFWIDRYELSVWDTPSCDGTQFGADVDDYADALFWPNGNWDAPLYACSLEEVVPATNITWFQAQQVCELSGKSLCTNAQWQAAVVNVAISACNTGGHGEGYVGGEPGLTGALDGGGDGCVSNWGAMDQVGNLWEWVADWQGHPGWNGTMNEFDGDPDQDGIHEYGDDGYWAGGPIPTSMPDLGTSDSWRTNCGWIAGQGISQGGDYGPAAMQRGGYYASYSDAGSFALTLGYGPGQTGNNRGARCCIQR